MKEQIAQRLAELRTEREKGEKQLADLRDTLLRIAGAIIALEEVLAGQPEDNGGAPVARGFWREVGRLETVGHGATVLDKMKAMSKDERAAILGAFHSCGSEDLGCQCENDE